ncbi:ankyrin repeat domain-containing protein [Enterococcus sp. DIV0242_7C1]|uniref:Uncharacterized protein n=1 Tax=Candidatus Enterococcus dunnyi TaxID=1834192 RepID=A0A200JCC7_9ENTE|nr:ankyrin repeat domain-containing protein [Enterococcus sp. DIV0242_7C1]OUZ34882.1 hypothetical protein A5889_000357 [Enterococcus sp. 9D6_DIV0238]
MNAKDNAGFTALHFAVMSNQYEIADYLITKGAKIDSQDNFGNTPLWRAAMEYEDENNKLIQLLLMNGADPRIENNYGISAESLLSE